MCLFRKGFFHNQNDFLVFLGLKLRLFTVEIWIWLPSLLPEITAWMLSNTCVKVKCKFKTLTAPTLEMWRAKGSRSTDSVKVAFLLGKISHLIFALFWPSLDYEITLDISICLTVKSAIPGDSHSNTIWQWVIKVIGDFLWDLKWPFRTLLSTHTGELKPHWLQVSCVNDVVTHSTEGLCGVCIDCPLTYLD